MSPRISEPLLMPESEPSNLLILCDIDREDFSKWKQAAHESLNNLEKWVELPSFHRVLMIFETDLDAQNAFEYLQKELPELHVFFGPNMPLDARPSYLALPDAGKLWFTSPPASPPGEWEQTVEDPPNKNIHHDGDFNDQLNLALLKYRAELEGQEESEQTLGTEICVLHAGSKNIPKLQVEFDGTQHESISLPKTSLPE